MSEPREFTFGDEDEPTTRARQENDVRSMTRSIFGTEQAELRDEQRMDPREFIAEARRSFMEFAKSRSLNAHEALHSWVDGIEIEEMATMAITAVEYCKYKIAERLGTTVEELDRLRNEQSALLLERMNMLFQGPPRRQEPETLN